VTIAKRPSVRTGCVRSNPASTNAESGIFLARGMDREFADLPVGQIRPARGKESATGLENVSARSGLIPAP
jgi:hypothetical protein